MVGRVFFFLQHATYEAAFQAASMGIAAAAMGEEARALGAKLVACDTTVIICGYAPDELKGTLDEVMGLASLWRLTAGARTLAL